MDTRSWNFKFIVYISVALFVVDLVMSSAGAQTSLTKLFLAIAIWQLRTMLRKRQNIPGGNCEDCLISFFCSPCAVTQMVGQMWARPEQSPGCTFDESPAALV